MGEFIAAVFGWVLVTLPALFLLVLVIRGFILPHRDLVGIAVWALAIFILTRPLIWGFRILLGPGFQEPNPYTFHPAVLAFGLFPVVKLGIDTVRLAYLSFSSPFREAWRKWRAGVVEEDREVPELKFVINAELTVFGKPLDLKIWEVVLAPKERVTGVAMTVRNWAEVSEKDPDEAMVSFFAPIFARFWKVRPEKVRIQMRRQLREFKQG